MAYGVKIKNDGLTLIIDSNYANWVLWEHGEGVSTAYVGSDHRYILTVTFSTPSAEPVMIAITLNKEIEHERAKSAARNRQHYQ